jgi:MoaA/NifB/PqqE/SkfB family radical SAM enzyme
MNGQHYPLLTLRKAEFSGSLAPLAEERLGRDPKARALATLSRFLPGAVPLVGLRAGLGPSGEVRYRPTGLLARGMGRAVAENLERAALRKGEPLLRRGEQLIYTLYQPPLPSAPAMKVLASRLLQERTGRPLPATHTLQLTSACQCDCVHCSAARHRKPGQAELTTEECRALIRQSEALGVVNIVFTGGEPMLRRDLYDLISFVDKREAIGTMFTNGMLLTEENVARLQEAGLFSLMVSLDSPDPEEHNRMRRAARCWERATEGIQRCLEAGLLCGISTYATPERLRNGQVGEMIELARALRAHEITIFDVVPTGRLLRQDECSLLSEADRQELCALEEEINARRGYPHVITQAHVNGPTGAGCYAAWLQFYSTAYGDIMPCDFTPLSFGSIRLESLQGIWDRMASHPAYCGRSDHCRMQDRAFRRQWIDRIPVRGPFPHPVTRLTEGATCAEEWPEDSFPLRSSVGIRA